MPLLPQERGPRLNVIRHEAQNIATSVNGYSFVIARHYDGLEAKLGKSAGKPVRKHIERVRGNIAQIQAICRRITQLREEASGGKGIPGRSVEVGRHIRKLREQLPAEEADLEIQKFLSESLAPSSEHAIDDEALVRLQVRLYEHATALAPHVRAIHRLVRFPPRALGDHLKDANLTPALKALSESTRNLHRTVLASIPGGKKIFDFVSILKDLHNSDGRIDGKTVCLDVEHLDEPVNIFGEENLLTVVMHNLVKNAIDHRDEQKPLEIHVRLEDNKDHVMVHVRDNGTGIPAELLPHLFTPGVSGRKAEARLHEEHGKGLAIVRYAVERLHHGNVAVQSVVGKGTTFVLKIPKLAA